MIRRVTRHYYYNRDLPDFLVRLDFPDYVTSEDIDFGFESFLGSGVYVPDNPLMYKHKHTQMVGLCPECKREVFYFKGFGNCDTCGTASRVEIPISSGSMS